jgi:hypothetical protein
MITPMRRLSLAIALVALPALGAACHHGPAATTPTATGSATADNGPVNPSTAPPKDAPATCGQVGDHVVSLLDAKDLPPEQVQQMRDMIRGLATRHCEADHWSPEVVACFLAAPTAKEADGCGEKLTAAQREAIEHDAERQVPQAMPPPPAGPPGPRPSPTETTTRSPSLKGDHKNDKGGGPKGATGNPCDGGE